MNSLKKQLVKSYQHIFVQVNKGVFLSQGALNVLGTISIKMSSY